jgi:hypothetical protein
MNRVLSIIMLLFSIIILPGCGAVTVQPNPIVVQPYNYYGGSTIVQPRIVVERPIYYNYNRPNHYYKPVPPRHHRHHYRYDAHRHNPQRRDYRH